nr:RecName: Full=Pleurostatin [Pleurotus ostreatus]
VRPYLVAF